MDSILRYREVAMEFSKELFATELNRCVGQFGVSISVFSYPIDCSKYQQCIREWLGKCLQKL